METNTSGIELIMDSNQTLVTNSSIDIFNASSAANDTNPDDNTTVAALSALATKTSKFKTWVDYTDYTIMVTVLIFAFWSNGISILVFKVNISL